MTFSRMEAALEDAFVEWINTFERSPASAMFKGHVQPIDTVVELADGVVLSEVLADIDDKWFKQIPKVEAENQNWVSRFNNQKKLYKLITRYFEEILGQDPELLPSVNLTAIAKDADLHELLLLCQLVIAIAVQSDNNRAYIEKIQDLPPKSQHALMVSIEEVMSYFSGEVVHEGTNGHARMSVMSSTATATSRSLQEENELEKLKLLEGSHAELVVEYKALKDRVDDLLLEKEDLKARLRDMDEAITQANSTGKGDSLMRTEIEHLKQDLEKSEDRRQETEMMLESHVNSINELQRKVEELTVKSEEATVLRDELEEHRHAMERMQKLEATLEKYKRKVDEATDLRRQIKALEDQNTSLLERSHHVEDEYRKVLSFKTLMDTYKEQVQQLEKSNRETLKQKEILEDQTRSMAETCTYLENERDRNMEQVQLLEERVRELEFDSGATLDKAVSYRASVVIDDEINEENSMEENMKKANVTELRLTIKRLKRQIAEMENNIPKSVDESAISNREKEHANAIQERDQLRQELAEIRNGIPNSLLNQTQMIMALRARILDLKKDATQLKERTIKLEAAVTEGTRSVAKDKASLKGYEIEHAKIQERLNRLEDITKMQLHDINRMLVEANYMNGINNGEDGNTISQDRPGLSDKDLEVIKEQNADLQIHVLHLQEEINDTQGDIRKVRDIIKLYNQLLQEMTVRFANNRTSEQTVPLLVRTPRTKEEEQDLLKKQIHDVRLQSRREQQLIISAWYDLARRNNRDLTNLSFRSTPSSWLGRQRKMLDSQLRQRLC